MRRIALLVALAVFAFNGAAFGGSISFTAGDVKAIMSSYGAPLSNGTNQWGLWAVRAKPIVTGGTYTITGGATTQTGWDVAAPSSYDWNAPYGTNSAWFFDISGAEAGYPANRLSMIMDSPANTFTSYFGNIVTAVDDASVFTFDFNLGAGAILSGWEFVVDGTKYDAQGNWVEDFFGGYGNGGGLTRNVADGYPVPEPATLTLLGLGLAGVARAARRRKK